MSERHGDDGEMRFSAELEALGVSPAFVDEEGPPVDRGAIEKLLGGELEPMTAGLVAGRISCYRAWFRACSEVLAQRAGENES
ncbi:MAG: hypothetical protein KY475_10040 [Planctomycetes bacterium]|nr:hypothetical protein [Planctomycetota bacterium]